MRKTASIFAVLLAVCLTMSSCTMSDTELKNRLIIEGMGVDREDGEFIVTVQALNTNEAQSSDEPASSRAVSVYTVRGESVSDALSQLRLVSGKNPLYSQNRIIIIGSSVENDIAPTLDFFVREYASRINVIVAVSETDAADILGAESESGTIGAKDVQEIIEQGVLYSYADESKIYSVMNVFSDKNSGVCIPLLAVENDIKSDGDTVELKGSRVFKDGKPICNLSADETVTYMLATGKSERCERTFKDSDSISVTVEILRSKTKVDIGKKKLPDPDIKIDIKCVCGVLEYASDSPADLDRKKLDEISGILKDKTEKDIKSLFKKMLSENKTDIFKFNNRFSLAQSKKFFESEDEWDDIISNFDPEVNVDIDLKRIGINSARFD